MDFVYPCRGYYNFLPLIYKAISFQKQDLKIMEYIFWNDAFFPFLELIAQYYMTKRSKNE